MKGKRLIDPSDLTVDEITDLIQLANQIIQDEKKYSKCCENKLLATLFYEPSTRTRFSFEAAMLRLGGKIIGFSEPNSSSVAKGESIADTIRTICCYADIIAMRHPKEGSAYVAANASSVPFINAGDGGHYHPTQTLTDLLTIYNLKGRLDNLVVGLCGDLKFGRTVHSLIKAMARYKNITFIFISPDELQVPDYIKKEVLEKNKLKYYESTNLEEVMPKLDILYMTRVQKERFFNESDYIRLKDMFILDLEKLKNAKEDLTILHPLPRVNEISAEVDEDSRAAYFKQAKFGMYVRMALMIRFLGIEVE